MEFNITFPCSVNGGGYLMLESKYLDMLIKVSRLFDQSPIVYTCRAPFKLSDCNTARLAKIATIIDFTTTSTTKQELVESLGGNNLAISWQQPSIIRDETRYPTPLQKALFEISAKTVSLTVSCKAKPNVMDILTNMTFLELLQLNTYTNVDYPDKTTLLDNLKTHIGLV